MTYQEALAHFGTGRAIARGLGVSAGRISQCKAAGGFSYPQQCVLEKASLGALVARHGDEPTLEECSPPSITAESAPGELDSERRTSLKPADRRGRRDTDLSTQEAKELLESAEKLSGTLQRIAKG